MADSLGGGCREINLTVTKAAAFDMAARIAIVMPIVRGCLHVFIIIKRMRGQMEIDGCYLV